MVSTRRRRLVPLLTAVLGLAAGLVVGGATVALSAGQLTSASGNGVTAVKVVRNSDSSQTTSTTFVDVPGATTSIAVPANTRQLLLVRFGAASLCNGATNGGCQVRIVVGSTNTEALPLAGGLTDFDGATSVSSGDFYESHMIERSAGPLDPGTYTVKAQFRITSTSVSSFTVRDWHFVVERIRA